ncbi:MAG TPA: VanZ family protein [Bacteroidales bacterium]|nr:VanZ family protein [Bacteroidales bacterium]
MKFLRFFWKTILWGTIVIMLSLMKQEALPHISMFEFPNFDKIVHFIMYFVFATLLIHDFLHYSKIKLKHWQIIATSIIIVVGYGGFLEILQRIPSLHRSTDFFDFLANTSGAIVASITFRFFEPLLTRIDSLFVRSRSN